jgi:hypothetical protein
VQGAGAPDPEPTHKDEKDQKDADAKDAKDPREEAYRQRDAEDARQWWQGTDREIPVKSATGDARQDAYQARDEHDANAWREAR